MRMRNAALVALGGVALASAIAYATVRWGRDHDALLDRFAEEKSQQLERALVEVEAAFDTINDDLDLALRLSAGASSPGDRHRQLAAMVAAVREYQRLELWDAGGAVLEQAGADTPALAEGVGLDELVAETAGRALERGPGTVAVSRPVTPPSGLWLRVFASSAETESGRMAAALVVDTRPMFRALDVLAADPSLSLLVLGARGRPAPVTESVMLEALDGPHQGGFDRVMKAVRARDSARLRLSAEEARALGLGDAEVVALIEPITVEGGDRWAVALLASTDVLRETAQAILRRLVIVVGAVAATIAGLFAYVTVTTRRTLRLRERLRHAHRLAHLHEKSEKILDAIPTLVAAIAEDGTIRAINRAFRERVGDAVGLALPELFPRGDGDAVAEIEALVAASRAGGQPRHLYGESLQIFGEAGTYNLHALPLERPGPEASTLLVVEDLSMLGSLERQLVRSEKMATVGILAAGIAHEVGTPLGVVRGRAELLGARPSIDETTAKSARIIIDQVDNVSRTIRRLLDYARLEPTADLGAVDLEALVPAVVELLSTETARRDVEVSWQLAPGTPLLLADTEQLQQVLVNLVMNAADACERGGHVVVTAAPETGGQRVQLAVTDDGQGIADEQRAQIFDPFFTTKKRGKGTGLGLSIVSQIARNHGATLEVESELGRGTRVSLSWPAARSQQAELGA